ncbi:hypothetical protein GCM10025779_31580 [Arthrobacter cryoconiti]
MNWAGGESRQCTGKSQSCDYKDVIHVADVTGVAKAKSVPVVSRMPHKYAAEYGPLGQFPFHVFLYSF